MKKLVVLAVSLGCALACGSPKIKDQKGKEVDAAKAGLVIEDKPAARTRDIKARPNVDFKIERANAAQKVTPSRDIKAKGSTQEFKLSEPVLKAQSAGEAEPR